MTDEPLNPVNPLNAAVSRRTVLTGAAVSGAALAAGGLFAGTPAAAAEAAAAVTSQQQLAKTNIKHVVFLMMENRSFDHLFGSLSGVRGFDDVTVKRPDGGNIFAQYNPMTKDYELPYRLSESNNLPGGDSDLSHNWGPQHISLNGGANDNWITAHLAADGADGIYTMGYLQRADAPYHYAMADAFTVQDNYFCSVLGPTYPNRLMWQMGSIDPNGTGGGPLVTTDENVFTSNANMGVFTYLTYPELLTKAGVTWKAYTEPASNHLLNMFPSFKQYNVGATTNPTNVTSGTVGATTGGFLADLNAGTLPQVSWIFPTAEATEHPGNGPINAGPQYYEPIITAFMESPSWADTALFITWDENDGYFDHVPPPMAPKGTDLEYLTAQVYGDTTPSVNVQAGTINPKGPAQGIAGPVGLGFRVPNIIISPWSTGGRVNSDLSDHTSVLKLVETLFGVPLKGQGIVSDWRYDLVSDLTSCFDFSNATPSGTPPMALQTAFTASQALFATNNSGDETPPAKGTMPVQETMPIRARVGPVPPFAVQPASTTTGTTAGTTTGTSSGTTSGTTSGTSTGTTAGTSAAAPSATGALAATGGLPTAGGAAVLVGAGLAAVAVVRARAEAPVVADEMAQATSTIGRKRVFSGGVSDSTQAGAHLKNIVVVEDDEA